VTTRCDEFPRRDNFSFHDENQGGEPRADHEQVKTGSLFRFSVVTAHQFVSSTALVSPYLKERSSFQDMMKIRTQLSAFSQDGTT
jgi:hypothetical protein